MDSGGGGGGVGWMIGEVGSSDWIIGYGGGERDGKMSSGEGRSRELSSGYMERIGEVRTRTN